MPERPPDPFRPHDVPRGRPFGALGRPAFAAFVLVGVVAAIVAVILVLALR